MFLWFLCQTFRTRQALIIEPLRPERFYIRTFNSTSLYILSVCEVCQPHIYLSFYSNFNCRFVAHISVHTAHITALPIHHLSRGWYYFFVFWLYSQYVIIILSINQKLLAQVLNSIWMTKWIEKCFFVRVLHFHLFHRNC